MTPQTVAGVLAYFTAAWPWLDPGESTEAVWCEALARFHDDIAIIAMKRLVQSEDKPPSIRRFSDECAKVQRDRAPQIGPGLKGDELERKQSAQVARALAAGIAVAAKDVPAHRNHDKHGGANCPACSTREDRRGTGDEIIAAIRSHLAAVGAGATSAEDVRNG
jgi:hypothetical protein